MIQAITTTSLTEGSEAFILFVPYSDHIIQISQQKLRLLRSGNIFLVFWYPTLVSLYQL